MKKLRLMTIAGTRPELIRLSEIIRKADQYFEHIFVHTGQNYDARLNDIFYDDLGIRRLNYEQYFEKGNVEKARINEFTLDNAERLNVEQVKEKLLALSYVREELESM